MPWSNQGGDGGGPWGPSGGGQSPWGRGSGPTPPDFEAMLRRGQDRVRRIMPSGLGGGRGIAIIIGVLVLIWLASGIYRVQPDQQGIVLRFGRHDRTVGEGLHYHLPTPFESVERVSVTRINRIDIGFSGQRDIPEQSLMLTTDENIVDIDFTVLWRIHDPEAYLFNIRNPEQTVGIVAESAMREVIGRTPIQLALTEAREEIEQQTSDLMQVTLDAYGVEGVEGGAGITIVEVQLQRVDPPQQVVDAFNDVLRARQDEQRLQNEATAYSNDIIPRARGDAERLKAEALGYQEQVVARAQGDAQRFLSVLSGYQVAPEVTAQRLYLETLEQVFTGANKIILDSGVAGGVVPYLPLDELQRRPVAPAAAAPAGQGVAP